MCWLIKNGVPFDVAHDLPLSGPEGEAELLAYAIVFGEFSGGEFDWQSMSWRDRSKESGNKKF